MGSQFVNKLLTQSLSAKHYLLLNGLSHLILEALAGATVN